MEWIAVVLLVWLGVVAVTMVRIRAAGRVNAFEEVHAAADRLSALRSPSGTPFFPSSEARRRFVSEVLVLRDRFG